MAAVSSWAALAKEYEGDDAEESATEAAPSKERWLHIGAHYMNPYRPTFQELLCHQVVDPETVCLEQTGFFYTDLEAAQLFNRSQRWQMVMYQQVDTAELLASLKPLRCTFTKFSNECAFLWPVPGKKVQRRRGEGKRGRSSRQGGQEDPPEHLDAGGLEHPFRRGGPKPTFFLNFFNFFLTFF